MKKSIIILFTFLSSTMVTFGQSKSIKNENLKNKIIALEQGAWEAWKAKDSSWTKINATEECLWAVGNDLNNKAKMMKSLATDCDVTSFSLSNFQLVKLNDAAVVITYVATQDVHCGTNKLPNKMRASVNYVKRNGKWLEAYYMEMPIE